MKFLGLLFSLLLCAATPEPSRSLGAQLRSEMESVVAAGPLHLRTREVSEAGILAVLVSWEDVGGGALLLKVISDRGEMKTSYKQKMTKVEFLDLLFSKDGTVELDGRVFVMTSPLARSKLNNGTTKVAAAANFQLGGKDSKPVSLEFFFDIVAMNLNPLNLWDGNSQNTGRERTYGYDEFSFEFSNWYEPRIQKAKAESVSHALRLGGLPDVVALQEIEFAGGASEVFAPGTPLRTALEELGYRSFLVGKQGAENLVTITTGFVSRYNLKELPSAEFNVNNEAFARFSERERKSVRHSTRDTQVVELSLGVAKARFLNTHWRSKGCSGEESCDLSERVRIANAQILNKYFELLHKSEPESQIFVMGDFNSEYNDSVLEKIGSSDSKSRIVSGKNASLFYNLWYELPKEARWEHEFQGERHTLSQMLLDKQFFGTRGFQYVDQSFSVVGQIGAAHDVLMNPNDTPLRWQESRLRMEEAPHAKRDLMKVVLAERGCGDTKKSSNRKCQAVYSEHTGIGFSDHLPQTARVSFVGDDPTEVAPQFASQPRENVEQLHTKRCTDRESVAASSLEFWKLENMGKCVFIDFSGAPQSLHTRGVYDVGYVLVKGSILGLTMNDAHSPKPRGLLGGEKSSDMCFARKVLQHDGGKVVKAMGRLGYDNGLPTLFLFERSDVTLKDLPIEKTNVCG